VDFDDRSPLQGSEQAIGDGVRAVLFDLDGTLYRQVRLRSLMAVELVTLALDGPGKASRRLRALRAYRAAQERLRQSDAGVSDATQLADAARASGLPVAEVQTLVAEWMMNRPLKYLQFCRAAGLDGLLAELDRHDVRAGVLSDYPAHAKLRALGLEGRFSPVLCATDSDIGAFKPSPRGFLRACAVWNLSPRDVLYVGDRVDVDAAGAAAAGMRCVIIGRPRTRVPGSTYMVLPSFERLRRVFDHH
jgi:FMN phosphatase YigB (HAD superfamily)